MAQAEQLGDLGGVEQVIGIYHARHSSVYERRQTDGHT
jgi:hypothetical protein